MPAPAVMPIPRETRQLLVVVTPSWGSITGTLSRFERRDARTDWHPIGTEVPVVMGRTGLAWGRGLSDVAHEAGPVKREGDGRSPAGIFRLGVAFGFDTATLRIPYTQLTDRSECVDDPASPYYNTLVEGDRVAAPDWRSAEHMRSVGPKYELGVIVDHNTAPREPGAGSCIFLHIWDSPRTPTAGCTALDATTLRTVVEWLREDAKPVLVQLPQSEYTRHGVAWQLPRLRP